MSAPAVPARDAEPASHRQVLEALSGLLLVLLFVPPSSTVVSTALPQIIGALRGSQTQYTWVVTATLLTATATTPVWFKLADLFNNPAADDPGRLGPRRRRATGWAGGGSWRDGGHGSAPGSGVVEVRVRREVRGG